MGTQVKASYIDELHEKFTKAKSVILADYRGMTVGQMTELRNQLRVVSVEFKVIKNTLARRAAKDTSVESAIEYFTGPTSAAFAYDDAVAPAKIMASFAKKGNKLNIKGGVVEGKAVAADEVAAIAELPSRDVLLCKMLGSMQAPVSNFVGVLGGVLREFLGVLNAIKEKKGGN